MRTDHVRAVAKKPDPAGRMRFGFVGSLVWYKGGATMLEAMRRLAGKPCTLNVFGDFKPESDAHHAELKAHAGSNVVFRGRFDNAKLAEVYAEIDVLIVPSVWFENAPITIHESHMLGTPVVASNIGGMAEFVRDGVDGLHFQVGDADDLARTLTRFLDEPTLISQLSRDFLAVKTIQEDAVATQFRYRQLAASALARTGESGERVLVDSPGIQTASREGGVEQQGADMLLLRARARSAVEYDLFGAGGGRRRIHVDQFALGAESTLELGARVLVDGAHVGDVPARTSGGRDGPLSHTIELDLPREARRLRIETLKVGRDETHARVLRVRVVSVPRDSGKSR